MSNFVLYRKFSASLSPTFHILTVSGNFRNERMKTIFCLFLLVVSYLTYSQDKNFIPKNYTEFSKNPSNGENFKRIESDFDNDNKTDIITVIHNKTYDDLKSNKKFLLIYLSSQKKNILVDFEIFYGVYFIPPKLKKKTLDFQLYHMSNLFQL